MGALTTGTEMRRLPIALTVGRIVIRISGDLNELILMKYVHV